MTVRATVSFGLVCCALLAPASYGCSVTAEGALLAFIAQRVSVAEAVFIGQVLEVERLSDTRRQAVVEVSRWWEGAASQPTVVVEGSDGICGDFLTLGGPFVFFSSDVANGRFGQTYWVRVRQMMYGQASAYSKIEFALDSLDARAFEDSRAELLPGMPPADVEWELGPPDALSVRGADEAWLYLDRSTYGSSTYGSCTTTAIWFTDRRLHSVTRRDRAPEPGCELDPLRVDWNLEPDPPIGIAADLELRRLPPAP